MAEENKPKIQKILIPPPRGGLNLHDNPLELNPVYATELTNFMPPTSVLEVRPAVERILEIKGQVRGMYSYTMGAIQLLRPEIEDPIYGWDLFGLDKIMIKLLTHDGGTKIYELNPRNNMVSPINYEYETKRAPSFNVDSAVFMNSLFFLDGGNEQIPYVYNEKQGLNKMIWKIPLAHEGEVVTKWGYAENIDNLTMYKGFLYANEIGTLNILYMNAQTADIENTENWKDDIFLPEVTDMFNLNGVLQHGGEIFRIDTISNATNNSVTNYLVVISTNGEMLVYDGTSPADIANWKLVGNFKIPIPLNKFCFCKMEGDIVAATSNGLVSLRRIIFGQQSKITEALEWRLSSLFNTYSFSSITLRDFFFLQYYQSDRLLIFNVPLQVPCRLDEVKPGYMLNKGMNLMLSANSMYGNDGANKNNPFYVSVVNFIWDYIVERGSDYRVRIWLNYSMDKYFDLYFDNSTTSGAKASVFVSFKFFDGQNLYNLFESDTIEFEASYNPNPSNRKYNEPEINKATSKFEWNHQFLISDPSILSQLNTAKDSVYKFSITNNNEITRIDVSEAQKPVITGTESVLDQLLPGQDPAKPVRGDLMYITGYNSYSLIQDKYMAPFITNYVESAGEITSTYKPVKNGALSFPRDCLKLYDSLFDPFSYYTNLNIYPNGTGLEVERDSSMLLMAVAKSTDKGIATCKFNIKARTRLIDIGGFAENMVFTNAQGIKREITNYFYENTVTGNQYDTICLAIFNELEVICRYDGQLFSNDGSLVSGAFSTKLSFIKYLICNTGELYGESFGNTPPPTTPFLYDRLDFTGLTAPEQHENGGLAVGRSDFLSTYTPDGVKVFFTKNRWACQNPLLLDSEMMSLNGVKQTVKQSVSGMFSGAGEVPSLKVDPTDPDRNPYQWTLDTITVKPDIRGITFGRVFYGGSPKTVADIIPQTDGYTQAIRDTVRSLTSPITDTEYSEAISVSELYTIGNLAKPSSTEIIARSDSSNTDLSIVPFLNQVNIDCAYKSEQYVMNSHYGTWAKWEDVNMVMGISHMDKFYFICLTDESISENLDIKKCFLCTFNKEFNGDLNSIPIKARYRSGHSDFGIPNQKLFKKVKIYGSNPTFWGEELNKVPYRFIFDTDFRGNDPIDYAYTSRALQPADIGILKMSRRTLDQNELKIYNAEYEKIGRQIRFIELPITANPATRISIGSEFSISEHNIVVYGYELYYVVVLP
jgi:hypothetical protein